MTASQHRRTHAVQNDLNVYTKQQIFTAGIGIGDLGDESLAATDFLLKKDSSGNLVARTGTDSANVGIQAQLVPQVARTRFQTIQNIAATSGTDTACDNGSVWACQVHVLNNATLTGVEYLIGSVGGTDKVIAYLFDSAGVVVANSALAGATVGTAAQLQQVAFTATYAAKGPSTYIIGLQFNGTTAKFRSIPAFVGQEVLRIKQTGGTFGTSAALSPVATALTADVGPICAVY